MRRGLPRRGAEFAAAGAALKVPPLWLGRWEAVAVDKGCYLGNEVQADPCPRGGVCSSLVNLDLSLISVGHGGGSVLSFRPRTASSPHIIERRSSI